MRHTKQEAHGPHRSPEKTDQINKHFYYIPINVISLDTVDFTECDPMFRITTLWFSESISPLSETDDEIHSTHSFFLARTTFPMATMPEINEFNVNKPTFTLL